MEAAKTPQSAKPTVFLPNDLHKIMADAEAEEYKKHAAARRKAADEMKELQEAFAARQLRPDAMDRVNAAVMRAAKQQLKEIELFRFPASFCNDGGRAINNAEPDWPQSLEGFAKRAYEAYAEHLRPVGYKMKAQVMSYPEGKLGEIALFLSW